MGDRTSHPRVSSLVSVRSFLNAQVANLATNLVLFKIFGWNPWVVTVTTLLSGLYFALGWSLSKAGRRGERLMLESAKHATELTRLQELEKIRTDILEHLHLVSVTLKNLLEFKQKQLKGPSGEVDGRYKEKLTSVFPEKEYPAFDKYGLAFGDTFLEFLDAVDRTLSKVRTRVNRLVDSHSTETPGTAGHLSAKVTFAGMHFADPRVETKPTPKGERLYYECGAGVDRDLGQKRLHGDDDPPPILRLAEFDGWCPVTSIMLHITTEKHHPAPDVAPEDCLYISIKNLDLDGGARVSLRSRLMNLVGSKDHKDHVDMKLPRGWQRQCAESDGDDALVFFNTRITSDSMHNIKCAQKTVEGLGIYSSGSPALREILDYDRRNLFVITDYEGKRSQDGPERETQEKAFQDRLFECIRSGLATISLEQLAKTMREPDDTHERYIYYFIPGSTKGRTVAGFFIAKAALPINIVSAVHRLFLPLGYMVVDTLTSLRRVYEGSTDRASEIMCNVYKERARLVARR